jgi:hypothetical protein
MAEQAKKMAMAAVGFLTDINQHDASKSLGDSPSRIHTTDLFVLLIAQIKILLLAVVRESLPRILRIINVVGFPVS